MSPIQFIFYKNLVPFVPSESLQIGQKYPIWYPHKIVSFETLKYLLMLSPNMMKVQIIIICVLKQQKMLFGVQLSDEGQTILHELRCVTYYLIKVTFFCCVN